MSIGIVAASHVRATYTDVVLADSPLFFLLLTDAASGGTFTDSSGNGRDFGNYDTAPQSATAPPGIGGSCVVLNHSNKDVIYNDTVGVWADVSTFSFETWFRNSYYPTKYTGALMGYDDTSKLRGWFNVTNSSGDLLFSLNSDQNNYTAATSVTDTTVDILDGDWHHVVGTYDGTDLELFIDGDSKGSTTAPATALNPYEAGRRIAAGDLRDIASTAIGAYAGFAMYGSVLSSARILAHYNAGIG